MEVWAALGGAALGGFLGFGIALASAEWSHRRTIAAARRAQTNTDIATLEAFLIEIDVADQLARRASPTEIGMDYYFNTMALRGRLEPNERAALTAYGQAVTRYNGRVNRIVAYGAAKRVRGENPGSEKPDKHAVEVVEVIEATKTAISTAANRLGSEDTA